MVDGIENSIHDVCVTQSSGLIEFTKLNWHPTAAKPNARLLLVFRGFAYCQASDMCAMGDLLVREHVVCAGHNVILSGGVLIQSVMLRFKSRVHDGHRDRILASELVQRPFRIDCLNVPVSNAFKF